VIPSQQGMQLINECRGEALVVSATTALREWGSISERRDLDLDLSDCMDKAPGVGLGLAIAQPERKVLVLDHGSVLRTNLGSLVTIGNAAPSNLVHFVMEDQDHPSTDGLPIPGMDNINFRALAEDGGYARIYQFDNLEDLMFSMEEVIEGPGPTFVSLKVYHDRDIPAYPTRSMADSLKTVRESLDSTPS